jgi:hypothetical protein
MAVAQCPAASSRWFVEKFECHIAQRRVQRIRQFSAIARPCLSHLNDLFAGALQSRSFWKNSPIQEYECSWSGNQCCRPTWVHHPQPRCDARMIFESLNTGTKSTSYLACLANETALLSFGITLPFTSQETCDQSPPGPAYSKVPVIHLIDGAKDAVRQLLRADAHAEVPTS